MRGTILIAGDGAAGCMAALTLLENGCPADKIILIDGNEKIAKKLLGNRNQWKKLYEANKKKIKDPNKIYPGQKLDIPQ